VQGRRAVPDRFRVPGYAVEDFLGRGAHGEVWRGRVRRTGAAVALKRIPIADAAQRAAALNEAAVLSALDHPHLVRLHETIRRPDAVVLVLDLAPAGSLQRIVAARGRLTPGEVVTATAPVAAALAYAHRSGVVHGDVTPGNIVFADNGMPLLADLGVARLLGCDAPVRTTPAYLDPALTIGGVPGPATDVFMIGGVALFALTGAPPWPGARAAAALAGAAEPARLDAAARLWAAGVPDEMARVLLQALRPDPAERCTAAEFALELRSGTRAVAVELDARRVQPGPHGRPATGVPAVPDDEPFTDGVRLPSPLGGRRRRRPGRVAVAATLVMIALAVAAALWPGRRAPSAPTAGPSAAGLPQLRSAPVVPPPQSPRSSAAAAPTRSATSAAGPEVPAPSPVLASLDAARAAAFAARDPAALGRVYASPLLLGRDRRLLLGIVPPGCGLVGVRTMYRDVRVLRGGRARMVVTAWTRMRPSLLRCGGRPAGRARGTPGATVRIGLVRGAAGYRIGSLQAAAE
jgi:hypothetical protein